VKLQELDAWKGCHELVLATWRATEAAMSVDREIPMRLRNSALLALGKVAFGAGSGDRRLFRRSLYRVQGWLWVFGSHLELARVMGVLPAETCLNLDALRGRAAFYVMRQIQRVLRRRP
jgi:hypothetical protein